MPNLMRLHILKCLKCHDLGFIVDRFDHSKRTPCTCQAAALATPRYTRLKDAMDKHASRLTQVGMGPAWQAQQVYLRMLRHKPTMRYKVKKLVYLSKPLDDPVAYSDTHGTIRFNERTGLVSVVLADLESDAEELAAGQTGPLGEI